MFLVFVSFLEENDVNVRVWLERDARALQEKAARKATIGGERKKEGGRMKKR